MEASFTDAIRAVLDRAATAIFGPNLPDPPIDVYLAGGAAVFLYTRSRVSKDVDAEFNARLIRPEVVVSYLDDEGVEQSLHLDRTYTNTLGVLHMDFQDRVTAAPFDVDGFSVRLLAPVDLAISKLARFAEHDVADIRSLIDAGLVDREEFDQLAHQAITYFVGDMRPVLANIQTVLAFFPPAPAPAPAGDGAGRG